MKQGLETIQIQDDAERAEDLDDILSVMKRYEDCYLSWQKEINRLLDESGLSYVRFAERCDLSRNTLHRWCKCGGAPRCRTTYIKIGFGLSMTSEQTSNLLIRYGGYPGLYPMDLFDAVCIFLLQKGGTRYADAERLYERCVGNEANSASSPQETVYVASRLCTLTTEEAFAKFVKENGGLFRNPHAKLRDFLSVRLKACGFDPVAEDCLSVHSMFSQNAIPSRFEKDVSNLMVHGIVPRRERLIALGLHLEFSTETLNEMLLLAGMEPLCAKNRLECILIYALQQLCLTQPDLTIHNAAQLLAVAKQPELQMHCRDLIEQYMDAAYQSDPDERNSVAEYIRNILAELAPEEAAELLELI